MADQALLKAKEELAAFLDGKKDEGAALLALNSLLEVKVSVSLLKETKIGEFVGKASKQTLSPSVQAKAIELSGVWKESARQELLKRKREDDGATSGAEMNKKIKLENAPAASPPVSSSEKKALFSGTTENKVRNMVQAKFLEAMGSTDLKIEDAKSPEDLCIAIENDLFLLFNAPSKEYQDKFRSLYTNLKHPGNLGLRHALLGGSLPTSELVRMTYEELAPPEVREERIKTEKFMQESRREDAKRQGATCRSFTCSKCKQNLTTFFQMQTRSADEPMTTFVTCVNCGHHWRF